MAWKYSLVRCTCPLLETERGWKHADSIRILQWALNVINCDPITLSQTKWLKMYIVKEYAGGYLVINCFIKVNMMNGSHLHSTSVVFDMASVLTVVLFSLIKAN